MANYRYPNLTIINESDLHDANPNFFSNAVIAKVPLPATDAVDIDVQHISKYGVDYFIRAHSSDASARMLVRGFANVSIYTLTLMPWTPGYGSTTVPLHTQGICTIRNITFTAATLMYWVSVYGQDMLVPSIAHIGAKKTTQHGDLLNILPLWYETYTEEMLGRMSPPEERASQRRGSSDLGTAHREEVREQYYAYAGYDDEATSRPRG
ncbi:unnamed protein product [Miscanthus lutarioriparius]|uniref:Uncharacterized protein n=1 Tax=Miscanthus lutarioriparius TaxID=422564 RepID=A0A811P4P9_9POAL|nr:unnamed protein product [Miscanthus lutarioriparius]